MVSPAPDLPSVPKKKEGDRPEESEGQCPDEKEEVSTSSGTATAGPDDLPPTPASGDRPEDDGESGGKCPEEEEASTSTGTTAAGPDDPPPPPPASGRKRGRKRKGEAQPSPPPPPKARKNPRLDVAKEAMGTAQAAKDSALRQLEKAERAVEEAKRKHLEAVAVTERADEELGRSRDAIVDAELEDANNGSGDEWIRMYKRLRSYKEEHGDILFPSKGRCHDDDGEADPKIRELSVWVAKQRKYRTQQKWQRKNALDRLNFIWDGPEANWTNRFNELVRYKEEHGNYEIPSIYKANPQLSTWVHTQRRHYKLVQEGKKSQLTQDRLRRLDEIGFAWEGTSVPWKTRFDALVAYKSEFGSFAIPNDYPDRSLAGWIQHQRIQYRCHREGKPSNMTQERIESLERIGFVWSVKTDWQSRYEELVAYQTEHGDCIVSRSQDRKLSEWCVKQRMQFRYWQEDKPSSLTPERMRLLTDIGFVWTITSKDKMMSSPSSYHESYM